MWAEHYAEHRERILDDLGACTGQILEADNRPAIRFLKDDTAGVIYVDDEPAAIVTVNWAEPCLRITYIQWNP